METSWTMIDAAACGVGDARDQFAAVYLPIVRKFLLARWRGSHLEDEVEDAVHEVFLDCLKKDGALARAARERGPFRGFLYGVSRHVAQRKESADARRHGREQLSGSAAINFAANETTLASLWDREWAKTVIREAFALQSRHAADQGDVAMRRVDLLRLRFHDDLPIREIARRWGVECAWLHHQYDQAKKEFERAWCEVMGLAQSGTSLAASKWREFLAIFAPEGQRPSSGETVSSVSGGET